MQVDRVACAELAEFRKRRALLEVGAIFKDACRKVAAELPPWSSRLRRRPLTDDVLQSLIDALEEARFDTSVLESRSEERKELRDSIRDARSRIKKLRDGNNLPRDLDRRLENIENDLEDME